MTIDVTLLGTFRVEVDGVELSKLPARPMRAALLAYLATEREASRQTVINDFQKRSEDPEKTRHRLAEDRIIHAPRDEAGFAEVDPDVSLFPGGTQAFFAEVGVGEGLRGKKREDEQKEKRRGGPGEFYRND